jgi:hypothetical protein
MGGYRIWLGLANQPNPVPVVGRVWKEIELIRHKSLGLATILLLWGLVCNGHAKGDGIADRKHVF